MSKLMRLIPFNLQRDMDLLWLLTHKEVTLQYKRTALGIFCPCLTPFSLRLSSTSLLSLFWSSPKRIFLSSSFLLSSHGHGSQILSVLNVSLIANKSLIKNSHFRNTFSWPQVFFPRASISSSPYRSSYFGLLLWKDRWCNLAFGYSDPPDHSICDDHGHCPCCIGDQCLFHGFSVYRCFPSQLVLLGHTILYQLDTIPEPYRPISLYMNP